MSRKHLLIVAGLLILTNAVTFLYCTVNSAVNLEAVGINYTITCSETAELSSTYTRYFDKNGAWPAAGTYETSYLKFVSTRKRSDTGDRVDEYLADVDGGTRVDVSLSQSGDVDVKVWAFMSH